MKGISWFCSVLLFLVIMAVMPSPVLATTIDLYDWAFHVDGQKYEQEFDQNANPLNSFSILPGIFDVSSFDQPSGLGTLTWTISETGPYTFIAFFDHEIDQDLNTYFNECGATSGTLATGQSWEVDEPG